MPNLDREQRHLDAFRESINLYPGFKYDKCEIPDFLFLVGERKVGIEHTEIFFDKDYPLQAEESIQDSIVVKAQLYADSKGYIPTSTKILFRNARKLNNKQREIEAQKIADYVQSNILASNKNACEQFRYEIGSSLVSSIYATVMPLGFKNHYLAARAGWVKLDPYHEIEKAIIHKSEKIDSYFLKCDEVSLLIVADGCSPSSFLSAEKKISPINSSMGFKRVFFMNFASKSVQEIEFKNT